MKAEFSNLQCTCAAYFSRALNRMITVQLCNILWGFFSFPLCIIYYNGAICVRICCRPMSVRLSLNAESMHHSLYGASYVTRVLLACRAYMKSTPWSSYEHLMSRVWIVIPAKRSDVNVRLVATSPESHTRSTRCFFSKRNVLLAQNDCRCAPHFCRKLIARARWCRCKAFNYIFRRCLTNVIFFSPSSLLLLSPLSLLFLFLLFFLSLPWTIGPNRLERSFLRSQPANRVPRKRSHGVSLDSFLMTDIDVW